MTEYHYNAKGQLVDKDGKRVTHNTMRDGEAISVGLMFTDSAAPRFIDDNDDGQAAYEARIAGAWRDTIPDAATVTDDGQELYERRMNDAWKATPADYPQAA